MVKYVYCGMKEPRFQWFLSNSQQYVDKQTMKGTVLWFPASDSGDDRGERGLSKFSLK